MLEKDAVARFLLGNLDFQTANFQIAN